MSATASTTAMPPPLPTANESIVKTILNIAWMSIGLGILIEIMLLALAAAGGTFKSVPPFIADTVQKVTWAVVVCVGLGFGKLAAAMRPQLTGVLGLLSAPLGFSLARAAHKAAEKTLGLAGDVAAGGPSPLTIGLIKAVEYAILGFILGWLINSRLAH